MTETITTERLTLRGPQPSDAAAIVQEVNDKSVSDWLTQVPYPYGLADAEDFIARQTTGKTWLLCRDDQAIGCIGLVGEFGYWIGRAHWGQGFATEAATAVLGWHFEQSNETIQSGHALGNDRSRRVLCKMGFADTDIVDRTHKITGAVRKQQRMQLTAAAWRERS